MQAGSELVRFCRGAGLIRGQCMAIDGSKFQAVASRKSVVNQKSLERQEAWAEQRMARYLDQLDAADKAEQDAELDHEHQPTPTAHPHDAVAVSVASHEGLRRSR